MGHKKVQRRVQESPEQSRRLEICARCRHFLGRNYPHCTGCQKPVEQIIQTVWQALLAEQKVVAGTAQEQELVASVLAHSEDYWWSEVEAAMQLSTCPACQGTLGYGQQDCLECISRSDMLWGRDLEFAADSTLLKNEHALRVTMRGLRQSHRYSSASLEGWHLFLPFLLQRKNEDPTTSPTLVRQVQAVRAWINAGRGQELAECQSFKEMYEITRKGRNSHL